MQSQFESACRAVCHAKCDNLWKPVPLSQLPHSIDDLHPRQLSVQRPVAHARRDNNSHRIMVTVDKGKGLVRVREEIDGHPFLVQLRGRLVQHVKAVADPNHGRYAELPPQRLGDCNLGRLQVGDTHERVPHGGGIGEIDLEGNENCRGEFPRHLRGRRWW